LPIFRSKAESLLLLIDVELDYSNSRINVCSCHTQEWPPQYERDLGVVFHIENDEINGEKETPCFHQNILGGPKHALANDTTIFQKKRPFAGVHHPAKFLPKNRPDSDLAEFYEIKKLDIVTKDFVEISK